MVTITLGDTILLDNIVGAEPANPWVLTKEESVKVNPLVMTNFNLAFGVGVATPILISKRRFVQLRPGKLLTIEFLERMDKSLFCLGYRNT